MKTNKNQKTIHQRLEALCRHRLLLAGVVGVMFMGLLSANPRLRDMLRQVYAQGLGIVGMYMRHDEVARFPIEVSVSRAATISGRF